MQENDAKITAVNVPLPIGNATPLSTLITASYGCDFACSMFRDYVDTASSCHRCGMS